MKYHNITFSVLLLLFIGCASQQSMYKKATAINTIEAYEEFLKKYPEGKFSDDAKRKLFELEYQKTIENDGVEVYKKFSAKYPNTEKTKEIEDRIFFLENKDMERRVFVHKSEKPDTLIFTGKTFYRKHISTVRTEIGITTKIQTYYKVNLYLDEASTRKIFTPFKGKDLATILREHEIQQSIIDGDFSKAIVFSFIDNIASQKIREDFDKGRTYDKLFSHESGDATTFLDYINSVKYEFQEGDEIVIRLIGKDKILTTVCGKDMPKIMNKDLAQLLLGRWIQKSSYSSDFELLYFCKMFLFDFSENFKKK